MKCPKSSQSCQTGDYQIKIIDNRPKPDPINLDGLDHPKMDKIILNSFPLIYLGGWGIVVLCIIFS